MVTSNSWQTLSASSADWAENAGEQAFARRSARMAKRSLDVLVSMLGLAVLLPLMAVIMAAIRLDSRGPVLYDSRRLGRNGRVFQCLKFRTMSGGGEMTRTGRWLRRYGLDELPQLINVLRGEMSIVGPRPLMASSAAPAPRLRRFAVAPGITGLWAIQKIDFPPFTAYISPDDCYRRNWTLWLDVTVMVRSMLAALAGRRR